MKSEQYDGDEEDDLKMLKPAQPKRNCKIIVFRRMMNNMCSPKEPVIMRHSMSPVATKIIH